MEIGTSKIRRTSITRKRVSGLAFLALLSAGLIAGIASAAGLPPAPTRWVTDNSGLLAESARADLDRRLEGYQLATGHQLLVYIDRTTGGDPIEDFAVKAFESWRIGRKGIDDGLAIFVFTEDRQMRIEVGYGLEEVVPDAIASRLIREQLGPGLGAGDAAGGLTRTIDELQKRIGDAASPAATGRERGSRSLSGAEKIILILLGIGFLILLITNPSLALYLLVQVLSSSGRSGGGGGGGGFSGGGGRSGGGGASGRW